MSFKYKSVSNCIVRFASLIGGDLHPIPGGAGYPLSNLPNFWLLSDDVDVGKYLQDGPTTTLTFNSEGPLIEGSRFFDGVWLSFNRTTSVITALLQDRLDSVLDREVPGENPVIHRNLCGSVVASTPPQILHAPLHKIDERELWPVKDAILTFYVAWEDGQATPNFPRSTVDFWARPAGFLPYYSEEFCNAINSGSSDLYDHTTPLVFITDPYTGADGSFPWIAFTCHFMTRDSNSVWREDVFAYKMVIKRSDCVMAPVIFGSPTQNVFPVIDIYNPSLAVYRENLGTYYIDKDPEWWVKPNRSDLHTGSCSVVDSLVNDGAYLQYVAVEEIKRRNAAAVDQPSLPTLLGAVNQDGLYTCQRPWAEVSSHCFRDFNEQCLRMLPQIIGASAMSAQNALDGWIPGFKSNLIETGNELGEILSPLSLKDDLAKYLTENRRFAKFPASRKFNALLNLLKLAASVDLATKFGIMPNISTASEVSQKLAPTIKAIENLASLTVIHGRASWRDLEDLIPGYKVSVIATTKMVVNPHVDTLLPLVLEANALGFLPSLSNLWACLPWSWLIDYGIDVNGFLSLLDSTFLGFAATVKYSVSSVKVIYWFDSQDQSTYNFRPIDDEDPPGFVFYARHVLNGGFPVVGPTTVPIFRPFRLPSWDILGGVIVQRL